MLGVVAEWSDGWRAWVLSCNLGCCRVGQGVGVIALQWRIVNHASDDVATTVDGIRGIETRACSFTNA